MSSEATKECVTMQIQIICVLPLLVCIRLHHAVCHLRGFPVRSASDTSAAVCGLPRSTGWKNSLCHRSGTSYARKKINTSKPLINRACWCSTFCCSWSRGQWFRLATGGSSEQSGSRHLRISLKGTVNRSLSHIGPAAARSKQCKTSNLAYVLFWVVTPMLDWMPNFLIWKFTV